MKNRPGSPGFLFENRESMLRERKDIRDIAIIAHVDHGKTTLVDAMLKQARIFRENQQVEDRVMDSNELERERGITILAKNTSIVVPDSQSGDMIRINIVDTPGHADFGGEVERIMNMVDGALLIIDSVEGPKPQTRFVLKQAIEKKIPTIVVINKLERRDADPKNALDKTFDLFVELNADNNLLDFPIVYADGLQGKAGYDEHLNDNLQPLFETIIRRIPGPMIEEDTPFQMLVTNLGYDEYSGVTATGRIHAGAIKSGEQISRIKLDGSVEKTVAKYLFAYIGLERVSIKEAKAGDIITIAGLKEIQIGETLTNPEYTVALPSIEVQKPTVRMSFGVNTSPFAGREGKYSTSRKIWERLQEETKTNIALRVSQTEQKDVFSVSGRGELHLCILIETIRREGYEFQVSRPEAIIITEEDGTKTEPFEELHVDVNPDFVGVVIESLGSRHGRMEEMSNNPDGTVHLRFTIPTRGLLGYRYRFLNMTHGQGIMNSFYIGNRPLEGSFETRDSGSIIAIEEGVTTTYGLKNAEQRGILFVQPGVEVYEGMIVGETGRPQDLAINVVKKKHLTNMRQSIRDIDERLKVPREMSLDELVEYLAEDELLEVTPKNLRLRKRILNTHDRLRYQKTGEDSEL